MPGRAVPAALPPAAAPAPSAPSAVAQTPPRGRMCTETGEAGLDPGSQPLSLHQALAALGGALLPRGHTVALSRRPPAQAGPEGAPGRPPPRRGVPPDPGALFPALPGGAREEGACMVPRQGEGLSPPAPPSPRRRPPAHRPLGPLGKRAFPSRREPKAQRPGNAGCSLSGEALGKPLSFPKEKGGGRKGKERVRRPLPQGQRQPPGC